MTNHRGGTAQTISAMVRSLILLLLLMAPLDAMAQTSQTSDNAGAKSQTLKPAELDQLVAPIALYPDSLLAEVLMASAYPTDVVRAERWLESHKNLKGDALKAAIAKQDWDDSVKSLVATPDVLKMMSQKLDWTAKLGDAVVAQQPDVMDAIQRLRARAQENDKLKSSPQQNVTVSQVEGRQIIAIEPTNPDTIYVPYYNPAVVFGTWPYPDYPPYYWEPPPYIGYGLWGVGLAFGAGWALGNWGNYWGGNINWSGGGNNIINRPGGRPSNPIAGGGDRWQPRVDHRQAGNRGQRGDRTNVGSNRPNRGQNATNRGSQRNARPSQTRHRAANTNRGRSRSAGTHPRHRTAHRGGINRGMGGGRSFRGGGRSFGGGGRGGRGGGGRRGGGRRSDITLKHDIVLLGHLANGLGFYRFSYIGSERAYVGVMAQEVQTVMPKAVVRDGDGTLRVFYEKLGIRFQTYEEWIASGARVPTGIHLLH